MEGARIGHRQNIVDAVLSRFVSLDAGGRGLQTYDQRVAIHAATAIESALFDLLGHHSTCQSPIFLDEGRQRDKVDVLGYLFFVGDRRRTNLGYRSDPANPDPWLRLRDEEALTIPALVNLAKAAQLRRIWSASKWPTSCIENSVKRDVTIPRLYST